MKGYLSVNFSTYGSIIFVDTVETVTEISAEEIGKLGLPVLGDTLDSSN